MAIRDRMERGESAEEAESAARREFGNVGLIKETTRGMWGFGALETFWQDLRYGARMLLKQPGFTVVAVITLALGIGANATIFSIVNALLLRHLPFPQPEHLVQVWEFDRQSGNQKLDVALPNLVDWRQQSQSFWSIAVYLPTSFSLYGNDEPERVSVLSVSPNYFKVIGVMPAQGRDFRDDDGLSGAPRLAILSHDYWRRRFAADPNVVGRTVKLNGENCAIIGVMPAGFAFPDSEVEVWTSMRGDPVAASRSLHAYRAVGRLKPGVRLEQAQAEMDAIARRLEEQYAGLLDSGAPGGEGRSVDCVALNSRSRKKIKEWAKANSSQE
jgi:hypothetical protein